MSTLTFLYGTAIFLGSFLLFQIEPIVAKRLLPLLGGSAAVWTTCLVFFQSALLLGYLCAHWLATRLRARTQALVYAGMLVAALGQSWFSISSELHASTVHPIISVFVLLSTLIGLPFLVLSATNPLLQAWYARRFAQSTGAMVPPYRLFALSNFSSLLALVVYPWLVEPHFSLKEQNMSWLAGFVVFVFTGSGCAWLSARNAAYIARNVAAVSIAPTDATVFAEETTPRYRDRILWLLLAACGSLLLSSVTNHLSQNVAAIPLLWTVPLIAYLLSFVWAFSGEHFYPRRVMMGFMVVLLGAAGYLLTDPPFFTPILATVALYCIALLIICLVCHAELHRLRPAPQYATSFYLMIAAGGALGSMFVGVLAPLVFSANYELVYGLAMTTVLMLVVTWNSHILARFFWVAATAGMVALIFVQRQSYNQDTILQVRNFYGTLHVTQTSDPQVSEYTRALYHGTIEHGMQIFSDELRKTPTTYYAHDSGVGLALDLCCGKRPRRVGVVGLGAGTLAAYGRKGDVFRFYDINPLVKQIASSQFTYLRESQANVEIVMGDARLSMAAEPLQRYDVLALDAFSGDAIPIHLLTREAIELYQHHLQPDGILAIHVSNKYVELAPVVLQQAEHAGLQSRLVISKDNDDIGVYSSDWVLVTANKAFLAKQEVAERGKPVEAIPSLRLWTDDYSSLLPILKPQKFKWE
jgi:spermidine synthase